MMSKAAMPRFHLSIGVLFIALGTLVSIVVGTLPGFTAARAWDLDLFHRQIARRVVEDLWNGQDPDAAADLYASSFTWHPPESDIVLRLIPNTQVSTFKRMQSLYSDLKMTVQNLIVDGDLITVYYTAHATPAPRSADPQAHWAARASGEKVFARADWDGVFIFRIEGGRIAEEWWYWDNALVTP